MFLKSQCFLRGFSAKNLFSGIRSSQNIQKANYVTTVSVSKEPKMIAGSYELDHNKKMNHAAKMFLEKAQQYDEMMQEANHEYKIGMRHLAGMMGVEPENFTQADADAAIEYLFPSGVHDKKARPIMRPPDEIFPPRKRPQFDLTGRPFHYQFYTCYANYYDACHQAVGHMKELDNFEDSQNRSNKKLDPQLILNLSSSKWVDKGNLEALLIEEISESQYSDFIKMMDRLLAHPYSFRCKEFIMKYRKDLGIQRINAMEQKKEKLEDGRTSVTIEKCMRKTAKADVTVIFPGTGLIDINGRDISFFKETSAREQLLFPLNFTNMVGKVDIVAKVEGGGYTGKSGAIRFGIASALTAFVDEETAERMRIAGLLTRDRRTRERKKFGQEGARRKFTWKKR